MRAANQLPVGSKRSALDWAPRSAKESYLVIRALLIPPASRARCVSPVRLFAAAAMVATGLALAAGAAGAQ